MSIAASLWGLSQHISLIQYLSFLMEQQGSYCNIFIYLFVISNAKIWLLFPILTDLTNADCEGKCVDQLYKGERKANTIPYSQHLDPSSTLCSEYLSLLRWWWCVEQQNRNNPTDSDKKHNMSKNKWLINVLSLPIFPHVKK